MKKNYNAKVRKYLRKRRKERKIKQERSKS